MNLLISPETVRAIVDFSERWGAGDIIFEDLKLIVPIPIMSVTFFQPERFSRLIACYFDFGDDIGFFFEDVISALSDGECKASAHAERTMTSDEVLKRNDQYVRDVLDFFAEDRTRLITLPPVWFERAVEISDAAVRRHFPDMADVDRKKKEALLDYWRQQKCNPAGNKD